MVKHIQTIRRVAVDKRLRVIEHFVKPLSIFAKKFHRKYSTGF